MTKNWCFWKHGQKIGSIVILKILFISITAVFICVAFPHCGITATFCKCHVKFTLHCYVRSRGQGQDHKNWPRGASRSRPGLEDYITLMKRKKKKEEKSLYLALLHDVNAATGQVLSIQRAAAPDCSPVSWDTSLVVSGGACWWRERTTKCYDKKFQCYAKDNRTSFNCTQW